MDEDYARICRNIDEEIVKLEQRLLELRSQRNQFVPISRLPVETMERIFQLAHNGLDSRLPLTLVSVSREWRDLVLDLPVLWSRIDTELKLEHLPAYMARSRQRPLHVVLRDLDPTRVETISTIFQEAFRLREVEFRSTPSERLLRCDDAHWNVQAPVLQKLHLNYFDIPKSIFSGQLPSLSELTLQKCAFDWMSLPTLPNLHQLAILRPQNPIPLESFLDRIHMMPSLARLLTIGALNGASNVANPPQFQLPSLTLMQLDSESCVLVAEMLRSLVLPHITHLMLSVTQGEADEQVAIRNALDHCTPFSTSPVKLLSVKARNDSCGYIINCEAISIFLQFHYTPSFMGDITRMCAHLNIQKIREVRFDLLNVQEMVNNIALLEMFGDCADLRTLCVRNDALTELVGYFNYECTQLEEIRTDSWLYKDSGLTCQTLASFWALKELFVRQSSRPWEETVSHLGSITRYLHKRRECEVALEGLSLVVATDYSLPNRLANSLRKLVGRLQVVPYDVKTEYDGYH